MNVNDLISANPNVVVVSVGDKPVGPRSIASIARDIKADWSKIGKGVNYAAKPYLDAMFSLDKISDNYGLDSGASVVAYFLANANSYRGEKAKALKAELKKIAGIK